MTTEALGSRTRHKLAEAKYFLDQLKAMYGCALKFDYYLSAFISSARAVLWVMKAEHIHLAGFEAWHEGKRLTPEEELLFGKIKDIRNRTEKVGPVTTAPHYEVTVSKEDFQKLEGHTLVALAGPSNSCQVVFKGPAGERVEYSAMVVSVNRKLEDFPDEHVLDVCGEYYRVLSKIVVECGTKFGTCATPAPFSSSKSPC